MQVNSQRRPRVWPFDPNFHNMTHTFKPLFTKQRLFAYNFVKHSLDMCVLARQCVASHSLLASAADIFSFSYVLLHHGHGLFYSIRNQALLCNLGNHGQEHPILILRAKVDVVVSPESVTRTVNLGRVLEQPGSLCVAR